MSKKPDRKKKWYERKPPEFEVHADLLESVRSYCDDKGELVSRAPEELMRRLKRRKFAVCMQGTASKIAGINNAWYVAFSLDDYIRIKTQQHSVRCVTTRAH